MALPILRRGGSAVPVRRNDGLSPTISRVDPWNDLAVMDRLFSSAFDNFFRSPFSSPERNGMAADGQWELYENGEALIAYLYAPGLAAEAFDISAQADSITVKGERRPLLEVAEGLTSHTPWGGLATGSGTFSASYALPVEIDPDKVQATYKDGVLQVRMPKSEAAKPRQVKVELGKS